MSTPSSAMLPAVGRSRPETRLNSVVLPAPFGPITARSSPSRTSSPTPETIVAPPMSSPRSCTARIGGAITRSCLLERDDRRRRVVAARSPEHLSGQVPVLADELDPEHRLQHRVVLRADCLVAL